MPTDDKNQQEEDFDPTDPENIEEDLGQVEDDEQSLEAGDTIGNEDAGEEVNDDDDLYVDDDFDDGLGYGDEEGLDGGLI